MPHLMGDCYRRFAEFITDRATPRRLEQAIEIAEKGFDDAVSKRDQLDEASTRVLGLLRAPVEKWTGSA